MRLYASNELCMYDFGYSMRAEDPYKHEVFYYYSLQSEVLYNLGFQPFIRNK